VKGFTPAAEAALKEYHWPGNVREMANCIERAMIFAEKDLLDRPDLIPLRKVLIWKPLKSN